MRPAEEAVIGCAILDAECARKAVDELTEEAFFSKDARRIFACMADLYWQGKPIDSVTVIEALPDLKVQIVTMAQAVPLLRNIDTYIAMVKSSWQDKVLRKAMSAIAVSDKTVRDKLTALDALVREHNSLMRQGLQAVDFNRASAWFGEWLRSDNGDRVNTGFRRLDHAMGGLLEATICVVSARTGKGKTDFAINLALKIAKGQKRVLYFSMEMTVIQLMQRAVSNLLKINSTRIRDKSLDEAELRSVEQVNAWISGNGKLDFVEEPRVSVARVREYVELYKPDVVVIDHIGLMERPKMRDQYKAVGMVSNDLKQLALEKRISIVELAQMNRAIEGRNSRKPNLADLRESGDIEQDADYIIFLVPEESEQQISGNAWLNTDLYLEKNRYGGAGVFKFHWQPQYHSYTEVENRY